AGGRDGRISFELSRRCFRLASGRWPVVNSGDHRASGRRRVAGFSAYPPHYHTGPPRDARVSAGGVGARIRLSTAQDTNRIAALYYIAPRKRRAGRNDWRRNLAAERAARRIRRTFVTTLDRRLHHTHRKASESNELRGGGVRSFKK